MSRAKKFADYHVFIDNLPWGAKWGELKDFFRQNADVQDCFADILVDRKNNNKSYGAAIASFDTKRQRDRVLDLSGKDFHGREITIKSDDSRVNFKIFCSKHRIDYYIDAHGNAKIGSNGNSSIRPTRESERREDKYAERPSRAPFKREEVPKRDQHVPFPEGKEEVLLPPPPSQTANGSLPTVIYGPDGMPLINDIPDIRSSYIYFDGFNKDVSKEEIEKVFSKAGGIKDVVIHGLHRDNKKGTVCFDRARDAGRAIIMFNNMRYAGNSVSVRFANEKMDIPNGLSQLGRPMSETQCADICKMTLNVDPFAPMVLRVTSMSSNVRERFLMKIFNFIGSCQRVELTRFGALVTMNSGVDGQQCINMLDDADLEGRRIKVKYNVPEEIMRQQQIPPPQCLILRKRLLIFFKQKIF